MKEPLNNKKAQVEPTEMESIKRSMGFSETPISETVSAKPDYQAVQPKKLSDSQAILRPWPNQLNLSVIQSKDKMEARIHLAYATKEIQTQCIQQAQIPSLSYEQLIEKIKETGVRYGFLERVLHSFIEQWNRYGNPIKDFIVAKGHACKSVKVKHWVPIQRCIINKEIYSQWIKKETLHFLDCTELKPHYDFVRIGDPVFSAEFVTPPEPGLDVAGQLLMPKILQERNLTIGKGLELSEDGSEMIATCNGFVGKFDNIYQILEVNVNTSYRIQYSQNRKEAWLHLKPGDDWNEIVAIEKLLEILKKLGIRKGLLLDKIQESIEHSSLYTLKNDEDKELKLLVARGQDPVHGNDAQIDIVMDPNEKVYEEKTDGSIDFKNVDLVKRVKAEQILAKEFLPRAVYLVFFQMAHLLRLKTVLINPCQLVLILEYHLKILIY